MILHHNQDPMGKAIYDFAHHGSTQHPLIVQSTLFEDDEMPVPNFFRTEKDMPRLERSYQSK